jgi:hypothetical protein
MKETRGFAFFQVRRCMALSFIFLLQEPDEGAGANGLSLPRHHLGDKVVVAHLTLPQRFKNHAIKSWGHVLQV